ncbi:MAG: PEP-CTERM sorting domain-containing protein, partial [Puniceicoccales bacterium]
FTLERTGANEMSLSFVSPTLMTTERTVTNDALTISTSFSEIAFRMGGNAWNETFPPDSHTPIIDITNFTVSTTGSVIPEPSHYALALGAIAMAGLIIRRRKR